MYISQQVCLVLQSCILVQRRLNHVRLLECCVNQKISEGPLPSMKTFEYKYLEDHVCEVFSH